MTSTGSTNDAVWLSGNEDIYFVSELIDGPQNPRGTGRTIRLALKYVELSLKVAPSRVIIEDHQPSPTAVADLSYIIGKIFNAINIDYSIQEVPHVVPDPNSLSGSTPTGKKSYYLYARPVGLGH